LQKKLLSQNHLEGSAREPEYFPKFQELIIQRGCKSRAFLAPADISPAEPEAVKKFPKSPPPCPSPVKGEGISFLFQQGYPLPHGEREG
jgi:hypothetical protein